MEQINQEILNKLTELEKAASNYLEHGSGWKEELILAIFEARSVLAENRPS